MSVNLKKNLRALTLIVHSLSPTYYTDTNNSVHVKLYVYVNKNIKNHMTFVYIYIY